MVIILLNVKIRPFRYGNYGIRKLEKVGEAVKIRPFRYGNSSGCSKNHEAYEVKIRPFRYGNLKYIVEATKNKMTLKSDRFGMEMRLRS